MSNKENRKSGSTNQGGDSEESLSKELEKESAEGKNSVGDVNSNRNLSGASSWDTLPDDDQADSGKKSS
jgi:hypothetical protein